MADSLARQSQNRKPGLMGLTLVIMFHQPHQNLRQFLGYSPQKCFQK